jgi:hypothetical protein
MSGPKVVRVVTREELIATCRSQLVRLDAAIAEWTRTCQRAGALDAAAVAAVAEKRQAMAQLLVADRFLDLQKQVPLAVEFLRSDGAARITQAAAAAAEALRRRRRMAITARMLLAELGSSGRDIPEELRSDLRSQDTQEQAITRALALLAPTGPDSTTSTGRQRELAASLQADEPVMTLSEWCAARPTVADASIDLKIDGHLAELTVLGVDPSAFAQRAAALLDEPPMRQGLLADSLLVELAQAVKEARGRAAQLAALRQCAAELGLDDSSEARDLASRIDAAVMTEDVSAAATLMKEAERLTLERLQRRAAEARRWAVLEGLARLGYQVTEGMATAWVQDGRVVLKKASSPGYGVELSGGTKSDRLQMRAVAFGSPSVARDTSRDRDIETLWCSEVERLRGTAADSGNGIDIERALPAGAAPLKVIEDQELSEVHEEGAPVTRTLQR